MGPIKARASCSEKTMVGIFGAPVFEPLTCGSYNTKPQGNSPWGPALIRNKWLPESQGPRVHAIARRDNLRSRGVREPTADTVVDLLGPGGAAIDATGDLGPRHSIHVAPFEYAQLLLLKALAEQLDAVFGQPLGADGYP